MMGALFMLTFDPDENVRDDGGRRPAAGCRTASSARRCATRRCSSPVLGWFLDRLWQTRRLRGDAGPQRHHARRGGGARGVALQHAELAEIIGQNQLRLLRHEDIVRQLCLNPTPRPGADRRRLRLRGPQRAAACGRAADAGPRGFASSGPRRPRRRPIRARPPTRSSRSSRELADENAAADGRGQAAHPHPADHEDEHRGEDQARHARATRKPGATSSATATSWWRWR